MHSTRGEGRRANHPLSNAWASVRERGPLGAGAEWALRSTSLPECHGDQLLALLGERLAKRNALSKSSGRMPEMSERFSQSPRTEIFVAVCVCQEKCCVTDLRDPSLFTVLL